MIRTCAAHIMLSIVVIMLAVQLPISSSYSCVEQCRTNFSAGVAQCQQENTNYLTYNMVNVCINQAHTDYHACTGQCPGYTMGPRRLPPEQVEPLPGYIPGTYR